MPARSAQKASQREFFLDGQLLIAMPAMGDPRFARSVIYLCAHSADGAMGIIINQRAPNISFTELLDQLNIVPPQERIKVPEGLTLPIRRPSTVCTGTTPAKVPVTKASSAE